MTAIDKALTGEWYEIKEARKALDSVAERLTSMQQEREEEHQKARRYREALERIRALDWNKEDSAYNAHMIATKALNPKP